MAENAPVVENKAPENNIAVNEANPFDTIPVSEAKPVEVVSEVKPTEEIKPAEEVKPVVAEVKPKEEVKPEVKEPTVAEIKFANEASQKLFDLLKDGKEDEVYNFLHEQRTLSTVDKLSPEAQIKLNLQYQHPEFTSEEIEDLFLESFGKPDQPEKPEQREDELDSEFAAREAQYKKELASFEKKSKSIETKISREAKNALKQLSAKKSELVLPDIPESEQTAAQAEPTAEEIAEQEKQYASYLQSIEKGVSEANGFETVFKEGNLVIPISLPIPDDEKAAFKTELQNFNVQDHFKERWLNEDGTWNGKAFAEDVYWIKNRDKIMQKLVTQAANQRLEQHLKEQKNIDFSGGRTQASVQSNGLSERDKATEYFLSQR